MREARMTFGEHLEELRWRIIMSLFYLGLGVGIAFAYGQELLNVALGPHRQAFTGAQRTRLIKSMDQTLTDLSPLWATSRPYEAKVGSQSFEGTEVHWEALFAGDVARQRLRAEFEAPFERFSAGIGASLTSLPQPERARFAELARQLGKDFADLAIRKVGLEVEAVWTDVPRRLHRFQEKIRERVAKDGAAELKSMVGWGRAFGPVLERLETLSRFLDERRQQAVAGNVDLDALRANPKVSRFVDLLESAVIKLEDSYKKLEESENPKIMVIDYLESFSAFLKVAVIFGLLLSFPFILYEMWKFVGAGLHLHEQRYVVTFLPFSLALFGVGALFGYLVMVPVALEFLAGWGPEEVTLNFTLGRYIGLFFTLTFILGLVFQTPLVMVFLAKLDIVGVDAFRRSRRISVFAGVCLAVVLTPPEPFSWALMAAPMILLYELGILVCQWLVPKSKEEVAA